MQIIIVGCGKVGRTLAEQLQEEDTDITLIDINADTINEIIDEVDAMGVVGNGASINTLMEAGIETADILIAVTVSDEMNLLCCLIAQKTGHCHTIARVRNPIYSKEIGFIKERLDHQSGAGCSTGDFQTAAFSLCDQDRYFCKRQGRASEIQGNAGVQSGWKEYPGDHRALPL